MPPEPPPSDRLQIPDYELLRPIGKGSYGEVWLARSVTGVFRVIKIVRRDRFEDERPYLRELEGISRFQAAATGRPRQLALLHVGRNDAAGYFYYVMEPADDVETGSEIIPERYIPLTLKELFSRRGRLPATECVQLILELARGLVVLHGAGLIHRDIKPSNIIFVQRVPKLADVGLVASSEATLTCAGTPGYAPYEGAGTVAADLFSLGKVLYEIATGLDRMEFPRLPADLVDDPEAPLLREINAIVLRACHPDPAQRHSSAEAFARDLELIQAGRSVAFYEALRRRLRAAAITAGFVALLAGGGAALLVWRSQVLQNANEQARRALYRSDLAVAQLARSSGDLGRARAALLRQIPAPGETDLRGLEWSILNHAVRGEGRPLEPASLGHAVQQIATDPSGRWVAASFADDRAAIWDIATGRVARRLENVRVLGGFTSDGLLVIDETNRALRFESPTQGTLARRDTGQRLVRYLPDGRAAFLPPVEGFILQLASTQSNLISGTYDLGAPWPEHSPSGLDVSESGSLVAISLFHEEGARRSRIISIVTLPANESLWTTSLGGAVAWLRWSRDGTKLLVNAGGLQPIAFSRNSSNELFRLQGHTARVHDACFSSDGMHIATASADQTVRIWKIESANEVYTLHGLGRPATTVSWGPSEDLLIAGDDVGNLRAFTIPPNPVADTKIGVFSDIHGDFAISSDQSLLAVTSTTNTIEILRHGDLQSVSIITNLFQPITFDKESGNLIAFSSDWTIHSVDCTTGTRKVIGAFVPRDFSVTSFTSSGDHDSVLMADRRGKIAIINWRKGTAAYSINPETNSVWAVAASPSVKEFWTATENGAIRRWDLESGTQLGGTLNLDGDPQALGVSSDGRWLGVALYNDTRIRVFDRVGLKWLQPLLGHRRFIQRLLFTDDNRRLISAGADGRVIFWRVPEFEEIAGFEIEPVERPTGDEGIAILHLAPMSQSLGALTEDGRLKIWRTD